MQTPVILPYEGTEPRLDGPPRHAGPGSAVLGRVTAGPGLWLGRRATIRADGHYVEIGRDLHLGPAATVHIAHERHPTHIGHGVSIGAGAVVHACDIGNSVHVGAGSVVLDGAQVGAGAALAPGTVVYPRKVLDGGWLYEGMPARPVAPLDAAALEALHAATRSEGDAAEPPLAAAAELVAEGFHYIAASARLSGRILLGPETGIWFGCRLEGGSHGIRIGENTNVQDNSVLLAESREISIGRDSTIGHNVVMTDCSVGDRSLVGIGAVLAPGTIIGDDVLLAAGARTEPGQSLPDGSFCGGAPARVLGPVDSAKKSLIALTWPMYCHYARSFADAQAAEEARR